MNYTFIGMVIGAVVTWLVIAVTLDTYKNGALRACKQAFHTECELVWQPKEGK